MARAAPAEAGAQDPAAPSADLPRLLLHAARVRDAHALVQHPTHIIGRGQCGLVFHCELVDNNGAGGAPLIVAAKMLFNFGPSCAALAVRVRQPLHVPRASLSTPDPYQLTVVSPSAFRIP